MPTNFPNTLDNYSDLLPGSSLDANNHTASHNNMQDAIEAIQQKIGINNSAVTTSIEYALKNPSSVNPGHKHTSAQITDFDTAVFNSVNNNFLLNEAVQDIVGAMYQDSSSIDFSYDDTANTATATVIPNSTIQKVQVSKNNTLIGSRKRINFIDGSGVQTTLTDDNVNDKVDVTITNLLAAPPTYITSFTANVDSNSPHAQTFTHGLGKVPSYINVLAHTYTPSIISFSNGYWNSSLKRCSMQTVSSTLLISNFYSDLVKLVFNLSQNEITGNVISANATDFVINFTSDFVGSTPFHCVVFAL